MKRKFWLIGLLLVPLALAIPLWFAASWKPHRLGVHPIRGAALPPFVPGAMSAPPQYKLMISPDGAHLLSVSSASKPYGLALWNLNRKVVIWSKIQSGDKNWTPLCFSRDGKVLAMTEHLNLDVPYLGDIAPGLTLFNVATGKQIAVLPVAPLQGNSTYIADAAFSPDGKQIIAAVGNEVRTWNLATRRETSRQTATIKPKNAFAEVALVPDGKRFIVSWKTLDKASSIHYVGAEMRDANSSHVQWKMATGVSPRFDFSPDGTKILSSDQSSLFEMRDVKTGGLIWKKTIANAGFNARCWLPDSSAIVVDIDDKFEFWDAKTGNVKRAVAHKQMQNFCVAPDNTQIYFVDFDGQIWSQRLR